MSRLAVLLPSLKVGLVHIRTLAKQALQSSLPFVLCKQGMLFVVEWVVSRVVWCYYTYSARLSSPTEFSTFCLVFMRVTTFTASCWDWSRVGIKSPLRIHSLLSTLCVCVCVCVCIQYMQIKVCLYMVCETTVYTWGSPWTSTHLLFGIPIVYLALKIWIEKEKNTHCVLDSVN